MSDDSKDLSPESTERGREVSRRTLLRAGTIAASAGVASVAAATIATPAAATDGQPIIQGQLNSGTNATTTITNSSLQHAAVTLDNAQGAPLRLMPKLPYDQAPTGSIFVDHAGSIYVIGDRVETPDGPVFGSVLNKFSAAFSTSVLAVTPERWLVTLPNFTMPNGHDGRAFVVPGSANYDSAGRVLPKNDPNTPDLTLDFSEWFYEFGIYGVQGTLLAMNATANGFVSMYDSDVWPGTSSMNFEAGKLRDGFTQMRLNNWQVHFKVSTPVVLVFDIFAFICGNGTYRVPGRHPFRPAAELQADAVASPISEEFLPRRRTSS